MPNTLSKEQDRNSVYVLARAYRKDGTVNAPRERRLCCALVELRERIKCEFLKVSKAWQVSAQDLRHCYSYAYPASEPGEADPLCLEQACEGLMVDLRSSIQNWAIQYGVPDGMLEEIAVDWLVSDSMGKERTPSAFFMPETEKRPGQPVDRLPSVMDLIAARPKPEGGTGE